MHFYHYANLGTCVLFWGGVGVNSPDEITMNNK